jgi:hypothetical protein
MLSIVNLFEITKNKKESNENLIKLLDCPIENSKEHILELEHTAKCFDNSHLPKIFLKISDKSVKKIFKNYLKENNLIVDWKKVKNLLKDVNFKIHNIKNKYKKNRPKFYLKNISNHYESIKDMNSYSFPSGHTTIAHYLAEILGNTFPKHSSSLKDLAKLIGQSRIENGLHYQSDIWAGQLLGEVLSKNKNILEKLQGKIKRKDEKEFSNHIRKLSKKYYPNIEEKKQIEHYCNDMAEFIEISNKIENYDIDKCFNSCVKFALGYPINYCSDDPHIISHLRMLCAAYKNKTTKSIGDFLYIHSHINKNTLLLGSPGVLRVTRAKNNLGNSYSIPQNINKYCNKIKLSKSPFLKHILFVWIHPFPDGNGRTGRVILAHDLDYNFNKVNSFFDKNYNKKIENFINHHKELKYIF